MGSNRSIDREELILFLKGFFIDRKRGLGINFSDNVP